MTREELLRKFGQKMLNEIDLLLRRNAEERGKLIDAAKRLAELDAEDAVLMEERAALVARGQRREETPVDDTRIGRAGTSVSRTNDA